MVPPPPHGSPHVLLQLHLMLLHLLHLLHPLHLLHLLHLLLPLVVQEMAPW